MGKRVFEIIELSDINDRLRNIYDVSIVVCSLAVAYVLASALVIFNVELKSFDTFFDALD